MNRSDSRLVSRAAWRVAAQTAGAVAIVVLFVVVVVLLVDEHQQHVQADRITLSAWQGSTRGLDAPAGTWIVKAGADGTRDVTPGAPAEVTGLDPRAYPDGSATVHGEGRELAVWTGDRDGARISAVYDLSPRVLEERRLVVSLAVASPVGVLAAAGFGVMLGRRAVRPLAEALDRQQRFVADASHELRAPLTILFTRAQLHREDLEGAVGAATLTEADQIVADAKVLGEVVEDLLLSSSLTPNPRLGDEVDLDSLAREATSSASTLARQHDVTLEVRAASGARVAASAPALRRAMTALLDNALAHTPPGGRVTVRVSAQGASCLLEVADDGEGLDPADAERLTHRFARGTSDGAGRRFGLGLSLVDEIARAHGGRLDVGGSFSAWLPDADGMRAFDPTGLVKGWAVQEAFTTLNRTLARHGRHDTLVNAGGDVAVACTRTDTADWRIAVEDPRDRSRTLLTVPLRTGAVATSGTAARGAHLIDPATGRAVTELLSVTVIGPELTWADVYATAAFARGHGAGDWLATRPGHAGVVVPAEGAVRTTSAITSAARAGASYRR